MNQQQYDRVLKAIRNQQAKGVKVTRQCWGVGFKDGAWIAYGSCACALGCFLLEEQPTPYDGGIRVDSAGLALAAGEDPSLACSLAWAFIGGFDGSPYRHLIGSEMAAWFDARARSEMAAWFDAGARMANEVFTAT